MTSQSRIGAVALLATRGELVPVLIEGVEGKRYLTRDAAGEVRALTPQRLFWTSGRRLEAAAELEPYWSDVRARAERCDLEAVWERCRAEQCFGTLSDERLRHFVGDGAGPEAVDAFVAAVFRRPMHFKVRKGRVEVESVAAVRQALSRREEEARREAELDASRRVLSRVLIERTVDAEDLEGDERTTYEDAIERIEDLAVFGGDAKEAERSRELLAALGRLRSGDPAGDAFGLLVELGVFEPDENLFVRRAGLRREFPPGLDEEAVALVEAGPSQHAPRDLTHLTTVAIDAEETSEVDDAFALDGDRLLVFIADVAAFVPWGSAVDEEARRRRSTVYLPTGRIPMLPPFVGEGAASLTEGEVRPALCFALQQAPDGPNGPSGDVAEIEVFEALCRVDHQLSYAATDRLLALGRRETEPERLVDRAARMMEAHADARSRRGAVNFPRKEVRFLIDGAGWVTVVTQDPNSPARRLISEMMVAVCAATGRYFREHRIPCLFRSQSPPAQPIDTELAARAGSAERWKLMRHLSPSALSTRCEPHASLAVPAYTQVTSPIRRYQDLLMHHQLKGWLRDGAAPLSASELMAQADEILRVSALIRRVEQDSRRYWSLRFLEQNPELTLEATVVRELGKRRLVDIDVFENQEVLPAGIKARPGDRLELRAASVDARRGRLVLRVA